ncbi:DUF3861 domain-containing protein [Photobacterium damselae]
METSKIKGHQYRITVEEVSPANQEVLNQLTFELNDREDMLHIVENVKNHSGLEDDDSVRAGVAIRLLGPVLMKNRKDSLFVDFFPHFKTFMQKIKSTIKANKSAL